jgi:hypothetical protein
MSYPEWRWKFVEARRLALKHGAPFWARQAALNWLARHARAEGGQHGCP